MNDQQGVDMSLSRYSRRALVVLAIYVGAANWAAAVQRTFVATSGNDANPCSLVAPCRGFAAAVNAVDDKGEVVVLDSGGYGAVTITKSVTITAPDGVYAGISVSSGTAVAVATASRVALRGLTLNGLGFANGVDLQMPGVLELYDLHASGLNEAILAMNGGLIVGERLTLRENGDGIRLSNGARAHIRNSRMERGGSTGARVEGGSTFSATDTAMIGNGFDGVYIAAGDGQTAVLNLDRCFIAENGHGIETRAAGPTGRVDMTISRSTFTLNASSAIIVGTAFSDEGFHDTYIVDNMITNNVGMGVDIAVPQFDDSLGKVLLERNTITRNAYGVECNASGLITRGNNTIRDNVAAQIGNCTATVNDPGS
jgi:hypothetical protein